MHNDIGNALSDQSGRQSEVLHHHSANPHPHPHPQPHPQPHPHPSPSPNPHQVLHHYSEASRLMPSFAEAFSNVGTILKVRVKP